ncbi:GDSL-type esterase/lipase family protein [Larkinella sp. C7]|uniref:GDSL-type esterase/lipase family protein n=1 Tax=Larkinella sp. C7 TaxID=2576607 RepID=UPI001111340F|nr:GDSL-type esterase/lipase family protein [Larkinella sp. C7]
MNKRAFEGITTRFILPILLIWVAAGTRLLAQEPRFESEIKAYEAKAVDDPPVPGSTFFVGSSTWRLWGSALEEDFSLFSPVNRGFGGATIPDVVRVMDRIILPHRPARIVFSCGGNDLAGGDDPETVVKNFKTFLARLWQSNPLTEVYFVSNRHSPARQKFRKQGDRFNQEIKKLAGKLDGLYYIDVVPLTDGKDGKGRSELFLADGLHLNREGQQLWIPVITTALKERDRLRMKLKPADLFPKRVAAGIFSKSDQTSFPEQKLNIVFIGNSITAGAGLKDRQTEAPPVLATAYLKQQAGIQEVTFSNQGVGGFTTVDFLPATHKSFPKVAQAAETFRKETGQLVFSIVLGTNDSAMQGPNGAPVSPESYRANLKTIADTLLKANPGCKLVIHHPIWYSPTTYNRSKYLQEGLDRLQTYFPEIDGLVADYVKTHPGQVRVGDTQGFNYFKTHYLTDFQHENGQQGTFFLHPNAKGAATLGLFWGEAIRKAVLE